MEHCIGTVYWNIVSEQRIGTLLMEPLQFDIVSEQRTAIGTLLMEPLPTKSLLIRTCVRLLPGQGRDTNTNMKQQIQTNTDIHCTTLRLCSLEPMLYMLSGMS